MVNDYSAPFVHKGLKYHNKDIYYDDNIGIIAIPVAGSYPDQNTDKLNHVESLRYRNHEELQNTSFRKIPESKIHRPADDDHYNGWAQGPEDEPEAKNNYVDANDVYTKDFKFLRFDNETPYRFIAVSTDYSVILIGTSEKDSQGYLYQRYVFEYPTQLNSLFTVETQIEYIQHYSQWSGKPFSERFRNVDTVKGVIISSDKVNPSHTVVMQTLGNPINATRFLLGDECMLKFTNNKVPFDQYDPDYSNYKTDQIDYPYTDQNDWYELLQYEMTKSEIISFRKSSLQNVVPFTGNIPI